MARVHATLALACAPPTLPSTCATDKEKTYLVVCGQDLNGAAAGIVDKGELLGPADDSVHVAHGRARVALGLPRGRSQADVHGALVQRPRGGNRGRRRVGVERVPADRTGRSAKHKVSESIRQEVTKRGCLPGVRRGLAKC